MLELKNLVFEVPVSEGASETKRIIDDLSLVIPDDSFTVITGPNGGGKSTLAKLIMGIEQATSGQILLAKGLCSFIWLVISYLSVVFIYGAVFSMTFALARDQMGEENLEMVKQLINAFVQLPDKAAVVTAIIAIASRIFLLIVFAISLVFFSITLSNVRPFQRQGFLPAVLIFVVVFLITQLISTLLNIYVPLSVSVTLAEGLKLQTQVAMNTLLNFGVADVIFQLAVTCFFFGFSAWLMNHKINLK